MLLNTTERYTDITDKCCIFFNPLMPPSVGMVKAVYLMEYSPFLVKVDGNNLNFNIY